MQGLLVTHDSSHSSSETVKIASCGWTPVAVRVSDSQ